MQEIIRTAGNFLKNDIVSSKQESLEKAELKRKARDLRALILRFAEREFKKQTECKNFIEFLDKRTCLIQDIRDVLEAVSDAGLEDVPEATQTLAKLISECEKVYVQKKPGWDKNIAELMSRWADFRINRNIREKKDSRFGLLAYEGKKYSQHNEFHVPGLREGEGYMEIHLLEAYLYPEEVIAPKEIVRSLERLAEKIVDAYPATSVVVGHSWLMDSPIAKRLGFQVSDLPPQERIGWDTWSQFIDQDGNLSLSRVQKLMEHGVFPYTAKLGVFPVDDFLKKYFPPHRRGKEIHLERLSDEWVGAEKKFEAGIDKLQKQWNTDFSIADFLQNDPEFSLILERSKLRNKFVDRLTSIRNTGYWKRSVEDPIFDSAIDGLRKDFDAAVHEKRMLVLD